MGKLLTFSGGGEREGCRDERWFSVLVGEGYAVGCLTEVAGAEGCFLRQPEGLNRLAEVEGGLLVALDGTKIDTAGSMCGISIFSTSIAILLCSSIPSAPLFIVIRLASNFSVLYFSY
jgi:hypothetical protein